MSCFDEPGKQTFLKIYAGYAFGSEEVAGLFAVPVGQRHMPLNTFSKSSSLTVGFDRVCYLVLS